jgi:hypothetical protein
VFAFLDLNLISVFNNYQISKSITHTIHSNFYSVKSISTVCDSNKNNSFYILDNEACKIYQFDENWNFLTSYHVDWPNFMINLKSSVELKIIVTSNHGIYSLDGNFQIVDFYKEYDALYGRMYYNESSDRLYVCATGSNYTRIDIFNHELKFNKSISTSSYSPIKIEAYNDHLYILTRYEILVYQNEIKIWSFNTLCSTITSAVVDNYGIAILCNSNTVYLYSVNGTYLNVKIQSLVPSVIDISFDSLGDLVFVASNGIFKMSNYTRVVNNIDLSADRQCIVNSMFFILLFNILNEFLYF